LSHYESDEPEELLLVELLAPEALLELESLPEEPPEAELFRP
jgi:hypothetical protein